MPAKRAAARKSTGSAWGWLYVVATLVAALTAAFGFSNEYLTWVLMLVAVVLGWFYFDPETVEQFGLRVVILWVVQAGLAGFPAVGSFITGFFAGWVAFLFPIVMTMAFHWFWKNRIATLF